MKFRKCEHCGSDKQDWRSLLDAFTNGDDGPEGEMVCEECERPLRSDRYDGARFVNIYEVNRGYGGGEEGGWWYDYGQIVKSFPVEGDRQNAQDAMIAVQKVVDEWNDDGRNRDISSVNCEGNFQCWIQDHPGRDFPDRKPHYE